MGSLSSFRRCKGVKELIEKINLVVILDEDARENAKKINELIEQRESDKKNRDEQFSELEAKLDEIIRLQGKQK